MAKNDRVRILVIDDEPVIKEVLQIAFEEAGWQVAKADTGEEGLRRLREGEFEVIVVDKNLPGMSGVDFIREVRKQNRVIRILLITAYGSVESAVESLNLGIDAYLEKPFPSVYDVVRAVKVALGRFDSRWLDVAPQEKPEVRPPSLLGLQAAARASQGRGLAVVVGSPDETVRSKIPSLLEARDRVDAYGTAKEVLAAATQGQPDAVILDASFGETDTLEVVEAISAVSPRTVVIVLADALPLQMIRRLIDLRVQALVERSAEMPKLRRRLSDVLAPSRRGAPR